MMNVRAVLEQISPVPAEEWRPDLDLYIMAELGGVRRQNPNCIKQIKAQSKRCFNSRAHRTRQEGEDDKK